MDLFKSVCFCSAKCSYLNVPGDIVSKSQPRKWYGGKRCGRVRGLPGKTSIDLQAGEILDDPQDNVFDKTHGGLSAKTPCSFPRESW
jgi:hypothetical protein